MKDTIRQALKDMIGKDIAIFFKYPNITYNIKKSGKLLDCDDKFIVVQEVKDGKSFYSYDFIVSVSEVLK